MPLNGIALFDYIMPGKYQCELTFKDSGSLKLIIMLDTCLSDRPQRYWTSYGTFQYNKAGQIIYSTKVHVRKDSPQLYFTGLYSFFVHYHLKHTGARAPIPFRTSSVNAL